MSLRQKYPLKDDLTTEEAVEEVEGLIADVEQWVFIGVSGDEQLWVYSHDDPMDARWMVDNALKSSGGVG